ncbi:MAG: hypothetical protein FWF53_00010 [Candidatus Azobacteroides sp.]|nr:hypothetical protein [Candidatus Azobacteroides sp.]
MKETVELRINYDYAHLLFNANEGKNVGTSIRVVKISTDDPRYNRIPVVEKEVNEKYDRGFCFAWKFKRQYSKKELAEAELFHLKITTVFEPAGEECGTLYDETAACELCGANRKQKSPLILKSGTIPKRDIAKTIGGEVVVSEKFANTVKQWNLKGLVFSTVNFEKEVSDYYQLTEDSEIVLTHNTITGCSPWNFSYGNEGGIYNVSGYEVVFEKEIYNCPKGDTIGLNLISEPYVLNSPLIREFDFFASKQKIGVKRGLLRPEPIYFCSQTFRKMAEKEKLSGFEFEIAHIE